MNNLPIQKRHPGDNDRDDESAIRGIAWGQSVADAIWA
jgi:hypothetical protein